ncbi:cryptochrome/photolyase family protein [Marinobacter nauticus]|jgi:deoxyribodipyrimidine photolyase-related protein|uniref:Deoxyribodipyrimidine photolyase-related protein n=1 Tax=Marinobacter nauticus TaxID=2743 RepID=A0A368UTY3_MARNT|nr:cryptochrome/photolyase family protein [Marinobacter nauticus]MCC4270007.1 cryptochrome/photolyase family protein [Marinobacter nauticus]RBP71007.1 deoxyribodipyrimidine photolyase-related protein [Marinobacter nauticus]RCW32307.1 deoxyribodipyrimidine photolyase-related protein [Marinobacter nauticus]
MANLILILGDQLSHRLSALEGADKDNDLVVMAEVHSEASYTNHHKKKLVFIFSAMRHFADALAEDGWRVHYQRYHPDNPAQSIEQVIAELVRECQPERVITTECGEWRLHEQISRWHKTLSIPVEIRPDTRFVCNIDEFARWAEGRKQLRMEFFYREMRKKTGLLMTSEGQPEGGQWNFDTDNRKKWAGKPPAPAPFREEPDAITTEVIKLVNEYFSEHFGTTENFHYAVTAEQAQGALAHFIDFALPCFGDYQDAMSDNEDWLFHSILSPYLNTGLLDPMEVCEEAVRAWHAGRAPLNAVEGFVRQIIGWREFVRGIYWLLMPGYDRENRLGNSRELPWFYWTGDTKMRCMHKAIDATARNAYAHHIQRLMVTGNFALLAGVKPEAICDWYLAVYIDAFDWVELPNTLGMVMHADGGYLGSKPYAASGKYIQRMSDHCQNCHYRVQDATGDRACPFNSLYWHFIDRHREDFANNPRMTMMYRNWDKQKSERREALRARADWVLANIETL